jgi:hypothetical protein
MLYIASTNTILQNIQNNKNIFQYEYPLFYANLIFFVFIFIAFIFQILCYIPQIWKVRFKALEKPVKIVASSVFIGLALISSITILILNFLVNNNISAYADEQNTLSPTTSLYSQTFIDQLYKNVKTLCDNEKYINENGDKIYVISNNISQLKTKINKDFKETLDRLNSVKLINIQDKASLLNIKTFLDNFKTHQRKMNLHESISNYIEIINKFINQYDSTVILYRNFKSNIQNIDDILKNFNIIYNTLININSIIFPTSTKNIVNSINLNFTKNGNFNIQEIYDLFIEYIPNVNYSDLMEIANIFTIDFCSVAIDLPKLNYKDDKKTYSTILNNVSENTMNFDNIQSVENYFYYRTSNYSTWEQNWNQILANSSQIDFAFNNTIQNQFAVLSSLITQTVNIKSYYNQDLTGPDNFKTILNVAEVMYADNQLKNKYSSIWKSNINNVLTDLENINSIINLSKNIIKNNNQSLAVAADLYVQMYNKIFEFFNIKEFYHSTKVKSNTFLSLNLNNVSAFLEYVSNSFFADKADTYCGLIKAFNYIDPSIDSIEKFSFALNNFISINLLKFGDVLTLDTKIINKKNDLFMMWEDIVGNIVTILDFQLQKTPSLAPDMINYIGLNNEIAEAINIVNLIFKFDTEAKRQEYIDNQRLARDSSISANSINTPEDSRSLLVNLKRNYVYNMLYSYINSVNAELLTFRNNIANKGMFNVSELSIIDPADTNHPSMLLRKCARAIASISYLNIMTYFLCDNVKTSIFKFLEVKITDIINEINNLTDKSSYTKLYLNEI